MDIPNLYAQAITAIEASDYLCAEKILRGLWERAPESAEVLYYFMHTLHKLNRNSEAVDVGRQLIVTAPSLQAKTLMANVLVGAGDLTEAADMFLEHSALDPMQIDASLKYYVLSHDADIDGVISTFRMVLGREDLRPDVPCILYRTLIAAVERKVGANTVSIRLTPPILRIFRSAMRPQK